MLIDSSYQFQLHRQPIEMKILAVAVLNILMTIAIGEKYRGCESPQYLEMGRNGIVECSFSRGMYALVWYDQEGYEANKALVRIVNGLKGGPGLVSGEYDIDSNGSLQISNVSLKHDSNFTVLAFVTQNDDPVPTTVKVFVTVKPSTPFPVINLCPKGNTPCFIGINETTKLECFIEDSRPPVSLKWKSRSARGDRNIISKLSVIGDSSTFTSIVSTTDAFNNSTYLSLLLCKADSPPGMLIKDEAVIVTENVMQDSLPIELIHKHVQLNSRVELKCSKSNDGLIIWKKKYTGRDVSPVLAYGVLFGTNLSRTLSNDVHMLSDGSLIMEEVEIRHEGLYICVFENDEISEKIMYNFTVYAPVLPVINGCNDSHYCVLEVQHEGILTCSVRGIRPVVQLEWNTISERDTSSISFTNEKVTITNDGDLYNIVMTSTFTIQRREANRISMACKVSANNIEELQTRTKFDLSLLGEVPNESPSLLKIPLIVVSVVILLVVTPALLYFLRKHYKGRRQNTETDEQHDAENLPMITPTQEEFTEKKKAFIEQLKVKYEDLYSAIQPIPYIRDRLYSVERVFVEVGLQLVVSSDASSSLDNYQSILNHSSAKSSRRILEGEPGYGKSTLALQFAFDWCNSTSESPLKDIEILILLRLRQLGGTSSIYQAIKQFILPRDSGLTVMDIKYILSNSASTLVILDGYDEYPDCDDETTDINYIITRQMFQKFDVILTTRPSLSPKAYAPVTKRVRITGFDDKAREMYVKKAVIGSNVNTESEKRVADEIKQRLNENPVIADLCQAPLFFVMFAHMSFEKDDFNSLSSVTSFFRHMITCFHSHMKNKMTDVNSEKFVQFEMNHTTLDRIAFKGLCGKKEQIVWKKEKLVKELGTEFYDHYKRVGILVEEEVQQISYSTSVYLGEQLKQNTEVRFYHTLFCEWYAAHVLAEKVARLSSRALHKFLQTLDPFKLQYLFRFACGLDPHAARKIMSYLQTSEEGERFAILCTLEHTGNVGEMNKTVRKLCSNQVSIRKEDSKLLQRSTIQVLNVASRNEITISSVWLIDCFSSAHDGNITLQSGLSLPTLASLKQLWIQERGGEFTAEECINIFQYTSKCSQLEVFRFYHCLLPRTIHTDCLVDLKTRNVQVLWDAYTGTFRLNLETGLWKDGNDDMLEEQYLSAEKMIKGMRQN